MIRSLRFILPTALLLTFFGGYALGDYALPGFANFFSFTAGGKVQPAVTLVNSSSAEVGITALPLQVGGAMTLAAPTSGGCTPNKLLSAASTNSTSIKTSAGLLCKIVAVNTTATVYFLKFYDTASAPACASGTVVATYAVPASTGADGVAVPLGPYGESYPNGIGMCLTGGINDNDNTSAAPGVTISYSFK